MIKVDDALKTVLKNVKTLDPEVVKLTDCLGRVLAEDIYSDSDIPPFDNSAMDGYAVRSADTKGASKGNPKRLEVVEDLRAGYVSKKRLKDRQAIRIMTGAVIPEGADSVVMVEDTRKVSSVKCQASSEKGEEFIEIFREVKPCENVRCAGEDVKRGEVVIRKGTVLKSAHIGLLASLGIPKVKVSRRPKVAILATGDELVEVGDKLKPGKIRNSNAYSLYGQVERSGALPILVGIARDCKEDLKKKIRKGLNGTDMLLVSGGISVGDYDLVKGILEELGTQMKFWKVRMRPGKPLAFGMIRNIPVFGLPGNPVSGMVSFEVFVRPAILKMLGQIGDGVSEAEAILKEDIEKKKGFIYFLRAKTHWKDGAYFTRTTGPQGSGILKSMVIANSLMILPESIENVKKGHKVKIRFIDYEI